MENGLNILSPKDRCVICSEERKSLLSSETVIFLYQPIMGADAAAVHAVLASSATTVPRKSGHLPEIGDILKTLDMEIPRFYDACCKLEALGLLRTFVHDVSNERRMIYQLLLPLSGPFWIRCCCQASEEDAMPSSSSCLRQMSLPIPKIQKKLPRP